MDCLTLVTWTIFTLAEVRLDISGNNREENLERKGNMAAPEPFSRPSPMLILIRLESAWALGYGRGCDCQLFRNHIWIFEYADLNFKMANLNFQMEHLEIQTEHLNFQMLSFLLSRGHLNFQMPHLNFRMGPFEFSNRPI